MLVNSFPRRWIPSVLFKGLAEFRTPLLTMLATPLYTYIYIHAMLNFCSFVVQQRTDYGGLETVHVSAKNCYYTGSVAGHQFSRVAFSMCDGEMVR